MRGIELSIVGTGDNEVHVRVAVAAPGFLGQRRQWPLDVRGIQPQGSAPVRHIGSELLERLRGANAEVVDAILQLQTLPIDELNPLYLTITDPTAAALPWETLVVENEFLALAPTRPIARIAEAGHRGRQQEHVVAGDLHLMAVLSALGQPAAGEWQALCRAVDDARAAGQGIRLTVLVGEADLATDIRGTIAAGASHITVGAIPDSDAALRTSIRQARPHLLHIYSHGSMTDGVRRLQLGRQAEWRAVRAGATATSGGAVVVGVRHLAAAALEAGTWLVVLNACQSGTNTPDAFSFAADLVHEGVPAAIGHRRTISPDVAEAFTRRLYPALLAMISARIRAGGRQEIEWAEVIAPSRSGLTAAFPPPDEKEEWSLPILYVGTEPFEISVAPTHDVSAANATAATEGTIRDAVAIASAVGVPMEALDRILAVLPASSAQRVRAAIGGV